MTRYFWGPVSRSADQRYIDGRWRFGLQLRIRAAAADDKCLRCGSGSKI